MPAPKPRHFSMSTIKQKLLNPAQTSVYLVDVIPVGSISKFMNLRNVNFNGTDDGELINLSCCEASLPGSGLATHEVTGDFHGVTEKMAYRRIYDDSIDLTFYVDNNYLIMEFFESWINYVVGEGSTLPYKDYLNNNAFYRMNWPDEYKAQIFITKFEKINEYSQPILAYTFIDAFPINISSIPISYEASDLLKITISFSYTRYNRVRTLERNSSYTGETSRNSNATSPGVKFNPLEQAAFNGSGNPEFAQFANPQFGIDNSGIDFGMAIPPRSQGNTTGTPFDNEGGEIISAAGRNNSPVEAGLPLVGRNTGPTPTFLDIL